MKVIIELPDNWLDSDLTGNLDWMVRTVREEVRSQVVKALAEQVNLPKLSFTKEEIKPLVAAKLADKQADELWNS